MKKTLVITLAIALLSSVLCTACNQNLTSPKLENLDRIRNATVLITLQAPNPDQSTENSTFLAYGVGSLIEYQGETLLVTHNHWRNLQDVTIVKFSDADNRQIKVIIKQRFEESIVYADAGTLVLKPPQELIDQLVPVKVEAIPQVAVGETVDVVYRENPSREKAGTLQAVVEEITTYQDQPVYRVRTLDGQTLQHGDSAGGIWYKGALVGNNWTVEAKAIVSVASSGSIEKESIVYTDVSYAAILPTNIY